MQKLGFQVTSFTRKSRKYSSYKGNVGKVAPNRIHRRFNTSIPHQKITTDTTEFKYFEIDSKGRMAIKKLYLDPFLDMFNGEVLSYSISKSPSSNNILTAQKKAIEITSDCLYRRTFHSDRGWAYQMEAYSSTLKENKIFQSMSRKGNCYDNSVMENFFGILKQEMYYGTTYYSFNELKNKIEKYIGDVLVYKTYTAYTQKYKRVQNKNHSHEQIRLNDDHLPIISKEMFNAVQQEKVRRSDIVTNESGTHRKDTRYSSKQLL